MRAISLVAIILIVVFIAPVYADEPGPGDLTITFTTSEGWLVANGADSCQATVQVNNGMGAVPGLEVEFLDTNYGTFNPEKTTTDNLGTAVSTFTVKHLSGTAPLKATVTGHSGTRTIIEREQKIDHDTPYNLSSYDVISESTVGTLVPITMKYQDRWRNPIDNKRITETVTFMVSSPAGDAVFQNSNSATAIVPVNEKGEAIAHLQLSKKTAINTVRVNPDMGSIPDKFFFIQGLADGTPVTITQKFDPEGNPPKVPINGGSFTITYTVSDKFENGIGNTPVHITTRLPGETTTLEEWNFNTNSVGQVTFTYGPKDSIGAIIITASATGNTGDPPKCEKEVRFVAQEIQNIQFTAAPGIMPSLDVDEEMKAVLKAKLVDKNGNPVAGETVTFTMGEAVYETTPKLPIVTSTPELSATSAVTDSYGFATVEFTPGGFTTDKNNPDYDDSASGSCHVTASWNGMTQTLQVSWKNYPYLSVETEVAPQTVKVGETVNVTIRVKGDGWALLPTPIDAMLCTDRSETMLKDNPDRMVSVMQASKAFTDSMQVNLKQDHIGLVSFGTQGWANLSPPLKYIASMNGYYYDWTYNGDEWDEGGITKNFIWVSGDTSMEMEDPTKQSTWPYTISYDQNSGHQQYINAHYPGNNRSYANYAVIESQLDKDPTNIMNAINSMVPAGRTPLRYGLYLAIKEIRDNGRDDAIRAVIVLSDGDYNYYGDPLARDVEGDPDPTMYTLGTKEYWYFTDLTPSEQNLSYYAYKNNITIYSIGYATEISESGKETLRILARSTGGKYYDGNAANIKEIYESIAEDLKEEAGVNTVMDLNYDTIEINEKISPVIGNLNYIPSTVIKSSYFDGERRVDNPPQTIDQSVNYSVKKKLDFPLGTINLGDIWEATYTLKVLTNGTINVFGSDSNVAFATTDGASQTIKVPKTYITAIEEMEVTEINKPVLNITVVKDDSSDSDRWIAKWRILRTYNGTKSVKQDIYLSTDGKKTWILMNSTTLDPAQAKTIGTFSVNWNELPAGAENIEIKVVGNPLDAPQVIATPVDPAPRPTPVEKNYIQLK